MAPPACRAPTWPCLKLMAFTIATLDELLSFSMSREGHSGRLGSCPVGDNAAEFGWLDASWFGRVLRQRKVSSRPVVVAKVAVQLTTKMFLAEYDHVVEEVPPDGPDRALGVGVLPWRPRGSEDFGDAHAFRASSKAVAPMVKQHDEHEEDTERRAGHNEEVDGSQVGNVIGEERPPRLGGWPSPPRHESSD